LVSVKGFGFRVTGFGVLTHAAASYGVLRTRLPVRGSRTAPAVLELVAAWRSHAGAWMEPKTRNHLLPRPRPDPIRDVLLTIVALGVFVFLLGGAWLLVLAYAESILWGMGCMLLWPAVTIGFSIVHWPRARWPLLVHFTGLLTALTAGAIYGQTYLKGLM
jgi:hypothetical protein